MSSGVSNDIFIFIFIFIVLALIATLCAPQIYFEGSKIDQNHCRYKFAFVLFSAMASLNVLVNCVRNAYLKVLRKEKLKCVILTINA